MVRKVHFWENYDQGWVAEEDYESVKRVLLEALIAWDIEASTKSARQRIAKLRAQFINAAPVTYLHYGKKVPKGFYETGRSIHLGKGIWLLRMRPNPGISTRRALAILSKLK